MKKKSNLGQSEVTLMTNFSEILINHFRQVLFEVNKSTLDRSENKKAPVSAEASLPIIEF